MRWYNLAKRLTSDSPHHKYRMAAVLVKSGCVLSQDTNGKNPGQHAELRVIRHPKVKGATVYVAKEDGRMSRPCPMCMLALKEAGVSIVVYADWSGTLVTDRLSDIAAA